MIVYILPCIVVSFNLDKIGGKYLEFSLHLIAAMSLKKFYLVLLAFTYQFP